MKYIKVTIKTKVLTEEKKAELDSKEEEYKYNIEEGNSFLNEEAKEVVITERDYEPIFKEGRLPMDEIESYYEDPEDDVTNIFLLNGSSYAVKENLEYLDKYFDIL